MSAFMPLQSLRDKVWPAAVAYGLATDMTGVSLPVPQLAPDDPDHLYVAAFLLYYVAPNEHDMAAPPWMRPPYAQVRLDLLTGDLVTATRLPTSVATEDAAVPSVSEAVAQLPVLERRRAQALLFALFDDVAQAFLTRAAPPELSRQVADWLGLFTRFCEPSLLPAYVRLGQPFFQWAYAQAAMNTPAMPA